MATFTRRAPRGRQQLSLALQGGGGQGAFTWGVLDRLLDQEDIEITAISGSSAGALNGAALATGLHRGGREGAKEHLAMLWNRVAEAGALMTFLLLPLRKPGMGLWDDALPLLSPYHVNPLGIAPLRHALAKVVDEQLLQAPGAGPRLYVNAVNVNTAQARVFGPGDITLDAMLASACAPFSYQAVEIDGQAYWDGSYAANPPLWPLYEGVGATDILLVELTPQCRDETPISAKNLLNRINEIASVSGLAAELRALDTYNRHAAGGLVRMHALSIAEQPAGALATEPSIKRTVGRVLFEMLRQDGRRACDAWLAAHGHHVGQRSTLELSTRLHPHTAPQPKEHTKAPERTRPALGGGHSRAGDAVHG